MKKLFLMGLLGGCAASQDHLPKGYRELGLSSVLDEEKTDRLAYDLGYLIKKRDTPFIYCGAISDHAIVKRVGNTYDSNATLSGKEPYRKALADADANRDRVITTQEARNYSRKAEEALIRRYR